jgi:hypothetical protein
MSQLIKETVVFRNQRSEYLFLNSHTYDQYITGIVLTDRHGNIIRSYEIPISLKVATKAMLKAGWRLE